MKATRRDIEDIKKSLSLLKEHKKRILVTNHMINIENNIRQFIFHEDNIKDKIETLMLSNISLHYKKEAEDLQKKYNKYVSKIKNNFSPNEQKIYEEIRNSISVPSLEEPNSDDDSDTDEDDDLEPEEKKSNELQRPIEPHLNQSKKIPTIVPSKKSSCFSKCCKKICKCCFKSKKQSNYSEIH